MLSISPMRVSEAWRLEVVWDREVRDGGYGRSRPRKAQGLLHMSDVCIDLPQAVLDFLVRVTGIGEGV